MLSFDEALAEVIRVAEPVGTEQVQIGLASGRILSRPIVSEADSPPADVSAMDGYAVRDADRPPYQVVGVSYAGQGIAPPMGAGECVRIFTGAPVPPGADRVIVQEIVRTERDQVFIDGEVGGSRHVRLRGSDFAAGDELLPAGRRLDARGLVAAAAADLAQVEVFRRPNVAVLGTGDELAEPGTARHRPGSIPESVTLGIAALVEEHGGRCLFRRRVGDDLAQTEAAARDALELADLLVLTGGASVGEKDFAKSALHNIGLKLFFSKVAMKPGKPVWFGRAAGRLVMGLPGNPTSAMVTGRLLLAPLIAKMSGGDPAVHWWDAALAEPLGATGDRETFVRARREGATVVPVANQDSGAQRTLAEADLLIRRGAGCPASAAGELVKVVTF